MPSIHTITSVNISNEQADQIKKRFGKAIEQIPGKSEGWLMVSFDDGCKMYFKGDGGDPCALVNVRIYGKANADAYNRLTGELTQILNEELAIPANRIFVTHQEIPFWGWNGSNF